MTGTKEHTKRSFVTIFPLATNIHLIKDVGLIPFFMHNTQKYESTIICYKNNAESYTKRGNHDEVPILDDSYSYLHSEVKGLRLKFIRDFGKFGLYERSVIVFLLFNSRKINILNLFHFKLENFLYIFIFKILNPSGIVYIKGDFNIETMPEQLSYFESALRLQARKSRNKLKKIYLAYVLSKINIVSCETNLAAEKFRHTLGNYFKGDLILLKNGINNVVDYLQSSKVELRDKKNIFVTIGRLGTKPKNTFFLLECLKKIDLLDWKFILIGPLTPELKDYLEQDYFVNNLKLKEKIIFTGPLFDRQELYDFLRQSKVFVLPSLWEGFPIVLAEALYFGNYIVASDKVYSAKELLCNSNIGKTVSVSTSKDLCDHLEKIIHHDIDLEAAFLDIMQNERQKIVMSEIIKLLDSSIEKITKNARSRLNNT